MRLRNMAATVLLFLIIPSSGWAQTAGDIRAWDEMRARELERLPKTVRSYANSIGCSVTFRPGDVVHWEGVPSEIKYLALISLDEGCAGGSATWRSTLLAVREGEYGKLFVHARYSLPELTSMNFPQLIDSIYNTASGVRFVGRIPQADDPANRPSKRVSGTVIWSGKEWEVLDGPCSVDQC